MKKVKVIPVKWIPEKHDTDGDGVPNWKDCDPINPKKHANPFGMFPIGSKRYAIYRQTTMGASTVRVGDPLFVGSWADAERYLKQMNSNPQAYVQG